MRDPQRIIYKSDSWLHLIAFIRYYAVRRRDYFLWPLSEGTNAAHYMELLTRQQLVVVLIRQIHIRGRRRVWAKHH
jgi:hypothetical protein